MKQIGNIILIACAAILFGCQEDSNSLNNVGYLRLAVSESGQFNTRAYDPKIMHVKIQSEDGEIVKQTNDLDEWDGEVFELPVGNYGIIAYSNDYKGEPAFNSPYYYGDTTVQVKANTETSAKVDCKIANVKVTVNYSEDFKTAFAGRDIFVTVGSADEKSSLKTMRFEYGSDAALYLPSDCGPLKATLNVSKADGSGDYYTLAETERLAEPKANDHFILNYQMGDTTQGDFTVTVDPTTNSYSYTFYINMTPLVVTASYETVNAWATFAYLEANNVTADGEVDPSTVKFNYRKKGETEWQEIAATPLEGTYTARPTGLEDNTTYEYCLAVNGIQANMGTEFTTEEAIVLTDGGFDSWTTSDDIVYPGANVSSLFWDTSNKGANTASWLTGVTNPTSGTTTPKISGTHAAQLKSASVMGVFAAASLYTGSFGRVSGMTATVNFGQSFSSRPISLHGYYQYSPQKISGADKLPEDATISDGGQDQCSIYIILSTGSVSVDNGDKKTLLTPQKIFDDELFIAYGDLSDAKIMEPTENSNGYSEFTIPLKYKSDKLDVKPTHIIVVCAASKYGDYMVGGVGSTLYVDEFSLVYDGTPTIWEN